MNPESPPTPTTPDRQYAVFISYRHADNVSLGRKWANWLHEALENYEVPADLVGRPGLHGTAVPASLYPVFRDEEELPADADLSANIQRALENSGLLVVLCSPRAVSSRFVADEIRHFKTIGRSDRILALMIDGEPNASDDPEKQKRFGAEAECFPEALRFGVPDADGNIDWAMRTEPIAADARPGCRCEQGWTTAAAYDEALEKSGHLTRHERTEAVRAYADQLELAKLKIIAGALGVPLGDLTQRDKARQLQRAKKRTQILFRLSALFAVLAIAAAIAGWLAMRNERRAVRAEGVAVTEKNRAENTLALSYHDRSVDLLKQGDWRAAMTYCAKAMRVEPKSALHSRMAYSLLLNHAANLPVEAPWESTFMPSVAFSPLGTHALMATGATPMLGDFTTGQTASLRLPDDGSGMSLGGSFSATGACSIADGRFIHVWEIPQRLLLDPPNWSVTLPLCMTVRGSGYPYGAAFMPAKVTDALQDIPGGAGQITLFNGKTRKIFTPITHENNIKDAVVVPDSDLVVSVSSDKTLVISSAADGRVLHKINLRANPKCLAVSASSQMIAVGYDSPRIQMFSLPDPTKTWDLKQLSNEGSVATLAFTPDGGRIAAGFHAGASGLARIWEAATGGPVSSWISSDHWVQEVCFDPKGGRLAVLSDDAKVSVHDGGGRLVAGWSSGRKGGSLSFVRDGTRLAVAGDDRRLQLFTPTPARAVLASMPLPDEVRSLAIADDDRTALMTADSLQSCAVLSLADLGVVRDGIKPAEGKIHSACIMQPAAEPFIVIITTAGRIEVRKLDGGSVAERAPPLNFKQLYSIDTSNPKTMPESVEISFGGGDAFTLDAARSRVVVAAAKLNVREVVKMAADIRKKGGADEEIARSMMKPDAKVISGEILFLDVPSLKVVERIEYDDGLISPRLSADGSCFIATNSRSGNVGIWRREKGAWHSIKTDGQTPSDRVNALVASAVSATGRWVGAVNADGTRVLDLQRPELKWREFATGERIQNLAFSPDERLVALDVSPSDFTGVAQIWDLGTLRPRTALLKMDDDIRTLEFSPDSSLLLTSSDDDTVRLWDTTTGRPTTTTIRTDGDVRAAHFIHQGRAIVFAGQDKKLFLSAVSPDKPAPAWAADALESFGSGALDDNGNERFVSGRLLFEKRQSMLAPTPGDEPWSALARFFWREKNALIPECPFTPSQQMINDCLDIWNRGDHSTSVARLREILRADPDAAVPEDLARPAALARLERGACQTLQQLDSRKAGDEKTGPASIKFRWCPPGQFMMGSRAGETGRGGDETPHQVSLSRGFWISETEVTQGQWEQVMRKTALDQMMRNLADPARFPVGANNALVTCAEAHGLKNADELKTWTAWLGADRPMIFVTWNDARSFCDRLSALMPKMKIEGPWSNGKPCRLPTEAEWEYACRAGTATATYAGDPEYPGLHTGTLLGSIAWYSGNASDGITGPGLDSSNWEERESTGSVAAIHAVATKQPNGWGLHDMLGNVNEWCLESYRELLIDGEVNPSYTSSDGLKSVRGGAFAYQPKVIRAARRLSAQPAWRSSHLGFRVVLLDGKETGSTESANAPTPQPANENKVGSTFHFGEGDGARIWTREAPDLWSEGYPDGHKDRFIVVSTLMQDGDAGEVVRKQVEDGDAWKTENDFEVFVPQLDAARPRIWWRRRSGADWGKWVPLSGVNIGKP